MHGARCPTRTDTLEAASGCLIVTKSPCAGAGKTVSASYDLEYGSDAIEVHADAITAGQRVVLVDDLIATGGTLAAGAMLMPWCLCSLPSALLPQSACAMSNGQLWLGPKQQRRCGCSLSLIKELRNPQITAPARSQNHTAAAVPPNEGGEGGDACTACTSYLCIHIENCSYLHRREADG